MALQTDNFLILDTEGFPRITTSADRLKTTSDVEFHSDVRITGSLLVEGSVVSRIQENVVVRDSFLDMGIGVTGSQMSGFNLLTGDIGTVETAILFTAGDAATSTPPKIKMSSALAASNFDSGRLIQVYDSYEGKNDGIYIVDSISSDEIILKGVGNTNLIPNEVPFAQSQLDTSLDEEGNSYAETAKVSKISTKVILVEDGTFGNPVGTLLEVYAEGSATGVAGSGAHEDDFVYSGTATYTPVGNSTVDLQTTYNNSADTQFINPQNVSVGRIKTNNGKPLLFQAEDGGIYFEGSVGNNSSEGHIWFGHTTYMNTFNVRASNTGTGSINLHATNPSSSIWFNVGNSTYPNMNIEMLDNRTIFRKNVVIGDVLNGPKSFSTIGDVSLGGNSAYRISFGGTVYTSILCDSVNGVGVYDLGSSSNPWRAVYADNLYGSNGYFSNLTKDYLVMADTNGHLVSTTIKWDSASSSYVVEAGFAVANGNPVDMGGNVVNGVDTPLVGTDAVNKDYVDGLISAQDNTLNVAVDGKDHQGVAGDVEVDLANQTLDFFGTANEVDVSLDLDNSGAEVTIGLTDDVTITNTLTVSNGASASDSLILSGGDLSLEAPTGSQTIKRSASSAGMDLDIASMADSGIDGKLVLSAQGTDLEKSLWVKTVPNADGSKAGIKIESAGDLTLSAVDMIRVKDTPEVRLEGSGLSYGYDSVNSIYGSVGIVAKAGETFAAGMIVHFEDVSGTPKMFKSDAYNTPDKKRVMHAISAVGMVADDVEKFAGAPGSIAYIQLENTPSGINVGEDVFLSATPGKEGQGTLVAPTASGTTVYRLGYLADASSKTIDGQTLWPIMVLPQFIAKRP